MTGWEKVQTSYIYSSTFWEDAALKYTFYLVNFYKKHDISYSNIKLYLSNFYNSFK